jgi:hypothetical protein
MRRLRRTKRRRSRVRRARKKTKPQARIPPASRATARATPDPPRAP